VKLILAIMKITIVLFVCEWHMHVLLAEAELHCIASVNE